MTQPDWLILRILQRTTQRSLIRGRGTSIADEIAEPRPDMNIKVTAFTESKKGLKRTVTPAFEVLVLISRC